MHSAKPGGGRSHLLARKRRGPMDGHVDSMRLADGRTIFWHQYGDPSGFPIFYFHGTPGSGIEGAVFDSAGKRQGCRIIAIDRPGVADSDHLEDRKVADWPADVAQVAAFLGIQEFSVAGWSGGGPHALVCAVRLAPLLRAVGLISPQGRYEVHKAGPEKAASRVWMPALRMLTSIPGIGRSLAGLSFRITDHHRGRRADKSIYREVFGRSQEHSQQSGSKGVIHDNDALLGDWGLSIGEIAEALAQTVPALPVTLWQGQKDVFVKPKATEELATSLPNTTLIVDPFATHLEMLLDHTDSVLRTLKLPRVQADESLKKDTER